MELNQEQFEELKRKTEAKERSWDIAHWLVSECGLSREEAREVRIPVLEEFEKKEKEKTKSAFKNFEAYQKAIEEQPKPPQEEEEEKVTACVTCGDPLFACDCPCKDPALTPF